MKRFIVVVALLFAPSAKADQATAPIDSMVPAVDSPSDHNVTNAHEHAEGHGGHHGAPTVNWWKWDQSAPPVGWFTVNFIIFGYLIARFAKKPLAAAMQNRHMTIKTTVEENQSAYEAIKGKHDSYRAKLANVEQESRELIESTKQDGALERDRIVKNAEEYAARLKDDTTIVIAHEEQRAAQRLQSDVAKAALANAEEMMRRGITDADRDRLFDQSLKEIESADETHATRRTLRSPAVVGGEA
ncbi:MAG: ATP synthase F0 subunit B [Clostridia bacterium]|nr:ATP synthase F0 subunit B [Deltaproteobacteria bacterium]